MSTNRLGPSPGLPWVPVIPLGSAYVAASARKAGHAVKLLDLCFEERPEEALMQSIDTFGPEAIGLSFRNVEMMTYFRQISFVDDLKALVRICRDGSKAKVILGGPGFSVMPEAILQSTGADLGLVGEGEWSFPRMLEGLDAPGVIRNDNGSIKRTAPAHQGSVDELPLPARELIDLERYAAAGGTANIQTKRGCPFECIYCTYPLIEGRKVRCRNPALVAEEFSLLGREYGMRQAYVVDNQFNYPHDHAVEICKGLAAIRREARIHWTCMLNPGYVSDELVFLLRMTRCAMVDLSIESASDRMLKNLGKNFTVAQIGEAIRLLKRYKLPFSTWILLGGPGECEETVRETLESLARFNVPQVLFSIGIRICPGTRLETIVQDPGRTYCLAMEPERIVELVAPYCHDFPGWRIAALDHDDKTTS
ncbi:MAG: cobalamin-dependent protein [Planctomycetota bacterium]